MMISLFSAAVVGLAILSPVEGAKKIRRGRYGLPYKSHDPVHLIVNKVGPLNNPTETYRYYSLPFCKSHSDEEVEEEIGYLHEAGDEISSDLSARKLEKREAEIQHRLRLGESIIGDRRETSPYDITFLDNVDWRILCNDELSPKDLQKFKDAIHNNFFFEMFIEDLPMWGFIGDVVDEDLIMGEVEGSVTNIYTHLHFRIGTNKDKIVSASVNTDLDKKTAITDTSKPMKIQFSYSVEWVDEPNLPWKLRMTRYAENRFLPATFEIHWLSIINSFVLVLLLTAFLTIILMRVLKNDFTRYMEIEDDTIDDEEESGWKLIHGDVFRFPEYPSLFCAVVGTGMQLMIATFCLLGLALSGWISTTKRGSILAGTIVIYCLTSSIGGYLATSLYRQMGGKQWARCVLMTALLFPTPVVAIFSVVNTLALAHGSTIALPVTAVFTIGCLYVFLSFPLTVLGGILAKNYASADFNAPTRTTKVAREIPTEVAWYRGRSFQVLIAGFLPFSAIYIELHYIFASMWGHQLYTLFGILLFAFILLVIVTAFITVALLYFQLAREDHRWWWASFVNGGMTGIFIYLYSFYYYFQRSYMSGSLQTAFYFGYMTIVSFAFFLMLGSGGFLFSLSFVKYIYSRVKCD